MPKLLDPSSLWSLSLISAMNSARICVATPDFVKREPVKMNSQGGHS